MTKKTKIVKNWRHLVEREAGLLYKARATKTPFTGVFEGRIWSAVKYYRIEYKNGKLDGCCEEYASNGSLWIRNNFMKGELHGTCLQFNQNQDYKTLWSITNYKNGELHGVFEGFFDDNVLSERIVFKNGKSHGLYQLFYENGQLEEEGNDKNGKPHGIRRYFDEEGNLTKSETWENGKLVKSLNKRKL